MQANYHIFANKSVQLSESSLPPFLGSASEKSPVSKQFPQQTNPYCNSEGVNTLGKYKGKVSYEESSRKPMMSVSTPYGEVKNFTSPVKLNRFIINELAKLDGADRNVIDNNMHNKLKKQLAAIKEAFNMNITLNDEISEINGSPVEYVQVLDGRKPYIAVPIRDSIVESARSELENMLEVSDCFRSISTEPHMTIVPPQEGEPTFDKETSVGQVAEFEPFNVNFDSFSISESGRVVLLGDDESQQAYREASQVIANALSAESNVHDAHVTIGHLKQDLVQAMFADPEKYGLEKRGDFLVKTTPTPRKVRIDRKASNSPLRQRIRVRQGSRVSPEEVRRNSEEYGKVIEKVKANQTTFFENPDAEFEDHKGNTMKLECTIEQLRIAMGLVEGQEQVPLTFSVRDPSGELWNEFKTEVLDLFDSFGIDDATIQVLGSGMHGFSRSPTKNAKPWTIKSDLDIAIFSNTLVNMALESNVQVNEKIELLGQKTCFKNGLYKDKSGVPDRPGKAFNATEFGDELNKLGAKWSETLYAEELGDEFEGDEVDFKLNISVKPFNEGIILRR